MLSTIFRNQLVPLIAFFGSSLLLHLLWENAQAPLFQGYESLAQHFPICLKATLTGDMLFIFVIYLALALVHQDWWWLSDTKSYRPPATWTLPIVIGVLLATSFELWAVHVAHRWQYTTSMPLLPIARIGVTPVLQMIILPTVVLFITKYISHRERL